MNAATPSEPDTGTRDRLAVIRTDLANERTLLAYLRTGLALVVGSVTAHHFLEDPGLKAMVLVLGVLGAVSLGVGIRRFATIRRLVRRIDREGG